jgi:hypothetical protein
MLPIALIQSFHSLEFPGTFLGNILINLHLHRMIFDYTSNPQRSRVVEHSESLEGFKKEDINGISSVGASSSFLEKIEVMEFSVKKETSTSLEDDCGSDLSGLLLQQAVPEVAMEQNTGNGSVKEISSIYFNPEK